MRFITVVTQFQTTVATKCRVLIRYAGTSNILDHELASSTFLHYIVAYRPRNKQRNNDRR
jgi:hypothetical protein